MDASPRFFLALNILLQGKTAGDLTYIAVLIPPLPYACDLQNIACQTTDSHSAPLPK